MTQKEKAAEIIQKTLSEIVSELSPGQANVLSDEIINFQDECRSEQRLIKIMLEQGVTRQEAENIVKKKELK